MIVATIHSISLGDYRDGDAIGCFVGAPNVIAFHGDISIDSDEWDFPPSAFLYSSSKLAITNLEERRYSHDFNIRLKQPVCHRVITGIRNYFHSTLDPILQDYMIRFNEVKSVYDTIIDSVPHSLISRDARSTLIQRSRWVTKQLHRAGISRCVATNDIDFSHILNTPIKI